MWLLNTTTCELTDHIGQDIPPYAILSHTWTKSEVLFRDIESFPISISTIQSPRFSKVRNFCALAKQYGFEYGWVDSCCIDKRSSAELSEAINSMYAWYRDAELCIVYLDDVPSTQTDASFLESRIEHWLESFKKSRWFTRGWTLQELIAPKDRVFFASNWTEISSALLLSEHKIDLIDVITSITQIPAKVLRDGKPAANYCIATRMSWASARVTTRPEDGAYCLLGLFDAAIPILYGEGLRKAFSRLQEEIMKSTYDQTLFVWRGPYESSGLLARYPSNFANTPQLEVWAPDMLDPHYMTNTGLFIRPGIHKDTLSKNGLLNDTLLAAIQCDVKTDKGWVFVMVRLKPIEEATALINGKECMGYRRVDCNSFEMCDADELKFQDLLVMEDRHYDLLRTSMRLHHRRWVVS